MRVEISDAEVDRVAGALGGAPRAAYTTPIVYPHPPPDHLGLYVHIPFCNYHCTFCFYAVRAGAKREEMERYVAALAREMEWVEPGTSLAKLVVGGGTPTALPTDLLDSVLAVIFERMAATDGVHTLEASPDSITEAHLRVLQHHGIGRVSVGVESMDDAVLGAVHRRHSPAQALAACRMVADSGLSLNVDLMYGLPGQTEDRFRRDLEAVADSGVRTVCLYAVRLNEKTPVAAQLSAVERLDLARLMHWRAFVTRATADAGFTQTRPYAFKRANTGASWHERATPVRPDGMRYELGIGMSARSQLGCAVYRNHERTDVYMQRVEQGHSPVESVFELQVPDRKTQFVASSLGNGKPLDRAAYEHTFGVSIDTDFDELLERLRSAELIDDDNVRIVLTDTGMLVYDRVLLCFYPQRARSWLHTWGAATPRRSQRSDRMAEHG
jgi:oxygen-independent coproporphyrinogen-3 oxidase